MSPTIKINVLTVTLMDDNFISIESDDISFSGYRSMYINGDGYGLQLNDNSKHDKIKELCFKLWNILDELNKEIKVNESN